MNCSHCNAKIGETDSVIIIRIENGPDNLTCMKCHLKNYEPDEDTSQPMCNICNNLVPYCICEVMNRKVQVGAVLGFERSQHKTERYYTCPQEFDIYRCIIFDEEERHGLYKVAETTDHCFEGEFLYKDNLFQSYWDATEKIEVMLQEKVDEAQNSLDHWKEMLEKRMKQYNG